MLTCRNKLKQDYFVLHIQCKGLNSPGLDLLGWQADEVL